MHINFVKMESACWGIKFKPIIKKVDSDDSMYFLEIVPEVSCLKNFDKIDWKHDNASYEYVIPVTYRVIVRRQDHKNGIDNSIDSLNPMYHSCVDLLHPSVTNTVLTSGDINRIVSDTFIVGKITNNIERYNIVLCNTKDSSTCDVRNASSKSMQTLEKREDFKLTNWKKEETCKDTKSTLHVEQKVTLAVAEVKPCEISDVVNNLLEKKDTDALKSIGLSEIDTQENQASHNLKTIREILPERCTDEYMQKLSLSPICSVFIKTECAFVKPPHMNRNDSILSYDYQMDRDIIPFMNVSFNNENLYNFIPTGTVCDSLLGFGAFSRITPEKRIDQFINLLRMEMLPLKRMLDDIVMRYTALNIRKNDCINTYQCMKQSRNLKMLEDNEITKKQQKHLKSNRVVYTMVFDG